MAVEYDTDVQSPAISPQRSGGWFRRLQRRIKLALAGSDDELLLRNQTHIAWRVYHDYHNLGIIDPGEQLTFKIVKQGSFNVRPDAEADQVEYLVLPLDRHIHHIRIYQRQIAKDVLVYDMRAA